MVQLCKNIKFESSFINVEKHSMTTILIKSVYITNNDIIDVISETLVFVPE